MTRPYAFKGRFSGTVRVPIDDGENPVSVAAKNVVGQTGAATVAIRVSQEVSIPPAVPDWNAVAPKLSTPLTLAATAQREDVPDTVRLAYGAVDPAGITEHLDETAAASLIFTGTTEALGPATLVLETPIPPSTPVQRRLVKGQLTSLGLGLAGQSFTFLETAGESGFFRTPVPVLPGTILRLSLGSMPDAAAIGAIRVKADPDPTREPEALEETAADSNVYLGTARGLGSVRIEIWDLNLEPDELARLRLFLSSSDLGLQDYLLDMQEETPGSLEFTTTYVALEPDAPPSPPTIAQSRVVGVDVLQGVASSHFEPVWVVARGATAFNPGETGQIDGRTMPLTTAALPAGTESPAASYERLSGPAAPLPRTASYVRLADPVVFAVGGEATTIPNVLPVPDTAGEDDPPAATHSVSATIQGDSYQAFFGALQLNQLVAIKGTQSRPQIWLSKPASTVEIAGDGVTTGPPSVDETDCRPGRPCQYRIAFPLTVTEDAGETRRDVRVRYTDGTEETFAERFHITHRRLIVFAVDGLGWGPFVSMRDTVPTLQRLFGTDFERTKGQNIAREVLTTFTPITFGRWASIFSGSTPAATGVPSNEYLNRRAIREGTAKWGDVSQCLGCGMFGHLTYTFTPGAYNHHFQVPFIYDRLHALRDPPTPSGPARGRKSVVFGQQAGLGMLNSLSDPSPSKWVKISGNLVLRVLFQDAKGRAYDAWVRRLALSELRRGPLYQPSADFDVMVLYLGGLDEDVHNGRVKRPGTDEVSDRPSEQYVEEYLDGVIGEVVKEASARLKNSAIYALVADHGHVAVDPTKQMDLDKRGWQVRIGPPSNGLMTWHDVLSPNESYRVSKTTMVAGTEQPANVVFVPHGGMAHVFVANDPAGGSEAWANPPSLDRLTPLVNQIHAMTAAWSPSAITDVLVRVPGPNGEFTGSAYRVVPRNYVAPACDQGGCHATAWNCGEGGNEACTLEAQLLDLSRMTEAPFSSGDPVFDYADPARRVEEWASENTGDIVLLANMKEKFFFDKGGLASNHGSLTYADAQTPLAFSYPGATSRVEAVDTVLDSVRRFLRNAPAAGPWAQAPVERQAMEAALGLTPCDRSGVGGCLPPQQP